MNNEKGWKLLVAKIPELGSRWQSAIIFFAWFGLFSVCLAFFIWFDRLFSYAPLVSQAIMALVCCSFIYGHMKNADRYRQRYGTLAYRHFFFHFIMPLFATWYACLLHPLFVGGTQMLPWWLAIMLGAILLSIRFITAQHIRKSGFDNAGHGLGIYTVFPNEGTPVHGEIYSYIRHPMYLGSLAATVAFGLFRNNPVSLLTAFILLAPALLAGWLEDRELVKRAGDAHREYIRKTGMLFPRRNIGRFLKFLFSPGGLRNV